jgi:hypothetical protein
MEGWGDIKLQSSIPEIKNHIPISCRDDSDGKTAQCMVCYYEGNREKNSRYDMLKQTKEIRMGFENGRLISILVDLSASTDFVGGPITTTFAGTLASMTSLYGPPQVRPGILLIHYTWENDRLITRLMGMDNADSVRFGILLKAKNLNWDPLKPSECGQ